MGDTVYITSLNYSPGLKKEFQLIGEKLRFHGFTVHYLLDEGYQWMMTDDSVTWLDLDASIPMGMLKDLLSWREMKQTLSDVFRRQPPDFIFFYNTHPNNIPLLRMTNAKNVLFIHEPHTPDKSPFDIGGRWKKRVLERLHRLSLVYASTVVVPSTHAYNMFQRRFPTFDGKIVYSPLLLQNSKTIPSRENREYVSTVGQFNPACRLDEFISLAERSIESASGYRFKIVTASDIERVSTEIPESVYDRLEITNPDRLTDEEIAETIARSSVLFLTHRSVTQSGNVPIAFRHGTPVLARSLPGFSQDIIDGENGLLLDDGLSPQEALNSIDVIHDEFESFSDNARQTFEAKFSEENWERNYHEVFFA